MVEELGLWVDAITAWVANLLDTDTAATLMGGLLALFFLYIATSD